MSFTLAIVGRPNVGKSTLFNRLVGKKLALVDDQPGVTRDLREGAGKLVDLRFTVIDTAGLEEATDESLQGRMRKLTERAVDMADICLFMVDARTGITPTDEVFAEILRKRADHVLLAANKAEGRAAEGGVLEAWNLGLGEPIPLSAEHGEGLNDLYSELLPVSEKFEKLAEETAPATDVVLDEDESRIEVVVPDDQLSLAIGRRGQNVRLASQLTGNQIDIMTEEEASEKQSKEFAARSKMFEEELDVDETLSQLLVAEGFAELEEVAYVQLDELAMIEGFDEELAEELQSRATEALERQEAAHREARRELGVEDALAELPHLSEAMLVTLGKAGLKTLDDVADLATDELIAKKREAPRRRNNNPDGPPMRRDRPQREQDKGGVLGEYGLTEEQGNEIIMAARAHWFEDEEPAPAKAAPATEQEAADADSEQ